MEEALRKDVPGHNYIVVTEGPPSVSISYLAKKVGCLKIGKPPCTQIADSENKTLVEGWIPNTHKEFFLRALKKLTVLRFCDVGPS